MIGATTQPLHLNRMNCPERRAHRQSTAVVPHHETGLTGCFARDWSVFCLSNPSNDSPKLRERERNAGHRQRLPTRTRPNQTANPLLPRLDCVMETTGFLGRSTGGPMKQAHRFASHRPLIPTEEELLNIFLSLHPAQRRTEFADTARTADIAGLSRRTIQGWIDTGLVLAVRVGKKYQVWLPSLRFYLRGCHATVR